MHSCWEHYYKKIKSISLCTDSAEYECLFEPDVIITAGDKEEKITLFTGIDGAKEFFSLHSPVNLVYKEFNKTGQYSKLLVAGEKCLSLFVSRRNLIAEINLTDWNPADQLIIDRSEHAAISLLEQIPGIIGMRILDPIQMHGFSIQINYGVDNIRNYYLYCFENRTIPETCTVDGYEFSYAILCSSRVDEAGNLHFSNGYVIPKHILYYHSYRQVQPEYTGSVAYDHDGIRLKSLYKLPLTEFKDHFSVRQYWGHPDECFGPKKAWLDDTGKRISDITLSTIKQSDENKNGATMVSVEPTCKYGFLKKDGTWLAPPIYDDSQNFNDGCAKVTRTEDGSEKTFLLTRDGLEKPFDFPIDVKAFTNNRCAFNAEKWISECPDAGYYWDYDWVRPGKWGFIDSECNIVVEPKYVFAAGFYNGGGDHSVVARYVDRELRWGVIDLDGNEVIPCKYPSMYCRWGEAVAFQTEKHGDYGLMNFDGSIIIEPLFGYIEAYNPEHKLITVGEDEDHLGVYSIELGKMLIPTKYDCIDYGERMISCELSWTCNEQYFDYCGNALDFSEYDGVSESGELLGVWKGRKFGLIDWEKNVIVPPIMENSFSFDRNLFEKGLIISGGKKRVGLSTLAGDVLIPEIYSELIPCGEFVIASCRTDGNWCLSDSLFTLDGKTVMSDALKRMDLDPQKNILSVETPTGVEFLKIETMQ